MNSVFNEKILTNNYREKVENKMLYWQKKLEGRRNRKSKNEVRWVYKVDLTFDRSMPNSTFRFISLTVLIIPKSHIAYIYLLLKDMLSKQQNTVKLFKFFWYFLNQFFDIFTELIFKKSMKINDIPKTEIQL